MSAHLLSIDDLGAEGLHELLDLSQRGPRELRFLVRKRAG